MYPFLLISFKIVLKQTRVQKKYYEGILDIFADCLEIQINLFENLIFCRICFAFLRLKENRFFAYLSNKG